MASGKLSETCVLPCSTPHSRSLAGSPAHLSTMPKAAGIGHTLVVMPVLASALIISAFDNQDNNNENNNNNNNNNL